MDAKQLKITEITGTELYYTDRNNSWWILNFQYFQVWIATYPKICIKFPSKYTHVSFMTIVREKVLNKALLLLNLEIFVSNFFPGICRPPHIRYTIYIYIYIYHSKTYNVRRNYPAVWGSFPSSDQIFLPNKICQRAFWFQNLNPDIATGKTTYTCRFTCFIRIILPVTVRVGGWEMRSLPLREEHKLKEVYMIAKCPEIFLPMKDEPGGQFRIFLSIKR